MPETNDIIGYRRNGMPIRLIRGGAEADPADADVAAVFGVDNSDAPDEPADESNDEGDEHDENDEGDEDSVEGLQTELAARDREIARLKRENAAQRVKARDARQQAKSTKQGAPSEDDVTAAEERGRQAARLEFGAELAGAKITAALTGIVPADQLGEVVEDLNIARYVTDEGKVDDDAVASLAAKYTALLGARRTVGKVGTGRGTGTASGRPKSTGQQFEDAIGDLLGSSRR